MKVIVNFLLIIILIFLLSCSTVIYFCPSNLCGDFLFPGSFIYGISGRYHDDEGSHRFEAIVYGKGEMLRFEILNMLGFAEFILIYKDDTIFIDNRRENIKEVYLRNEHRFVLLGIDLFRVHPGFIITGRDHHIPKKYGVEKIINGMNDAYIKANPFDRSRGKYTIYRKLRDDTISFTAQKPYKIGECLFFKSRTVKYRENLLEYEVDYVNINVNIEDRIFSW